MAVWRSETHLLVAVERDNNNKVFYYESIWLAIITFNKELLFASIQHRAPTHTRARVNTIEMDIDAIRLMLFDNDDDSL